MIAGADIARLVRNVYELNLNISIIALPWDGSISDIPGTDMKTVSIDQSQVSLNHLNHHRSAYCSLNQSQLSIYNLS